jgi:glycosyltransferase involved in cell wall biosynthesis
MPLVSVIIPCHNAEPWLAAAIESALAQTWADKEIIVVDDGSTDASCDIARSFGARGVIVAVQPNRGASAARNRGLRLSRGELIQYLDADDLLSADKISAQVEVLRSVPYGAVASCRWGRFSGAPEETAFRDPGVFRDFSPAREFLVHHADTGEMMHPAAWLTPRALTQAAGPWDESLSLNDDGEYFCRVLVHAPAIRFSQKGSAHYRSNVPGSLSQRRSPAALASLFRSADLFAAHLLSAEDSPRIRAALANYWLRNQFELYPEAPAQSAEAGRRSRAIGQATIPAPFGPRLRAVAAVAGWRLARRLQSWRQRRP